MSTSEVLTLLHQLTSLRNMTVIFTGIYFHEFLTNLDHDWTILRRQKEHRLGARVAQWTYLSCRLLALFYGICISIVAFPGRRNCEVVMKLNVITNFLSMLCSSALLSIRIGAIWRWNRFIVSTLLTILLVTLGLAIYCVVKINSSYDTTIQFCGLDGVHTALPAFVGILLGDCALLALLLVGLQTKWRDVRKLRTWRLLWTQGWVYVLLAIVVEVPSVVLPVLDINPFLNSMFITPEAIILAVGATRLFRSLNSATQGDIVSQQFTVSREAVVPRHNIRLKPLRGRRTGRVPDIAKSRA
ncbi:unnamed protein product [Peniophora sp. CBMAI 1063]|nr:unnamed protein product [Peniophora sp. CBMAI 1063]